MKMILHSCLLLMTMLKMSECFSQDYISNEKKMIVGVWKAEEGTRKLIFTSNICKEFFGGKLDATYTYKITNNPIQCDHKVHVSEVEKTSYLELRNIKGGSKTCYEINGVDKESLSITELDAPEASVFKRKKDALK